MKILICTSFFEKKVGAALFPKHALAINALYPEHEVRILTNDFKTYNDKIYRLNIQYPRFLNSLYFILCNVNFYFAIKKIKKNYNFDIILFNDPANGVLSKLAFAKSKKIIAIVHDDNSEPARFAHNSHRKLLIRYFIKKWEQFAINKLDFVLCPSKFIQNYCQSVLKEKTKAKLLYQSIDIQSIQYHLPRFLDYHNIKILFVKFGFIRGGLLELIDALGKLQKYNFILTIVGTAPHFDDFIKNKASNYRNIALDIKNICDTEMVYTYMREHDIFCVPATEEVLGLANVEALAHGLRVVSTNVGGIPEVLDFGKNGWLVEALNPESLAEGLQECIEATPSVFLAKSETGRQFVEDNFDHRNMIKKFVAICDKLMCE